MTKQRLALALIFTLIFSGLQGRSLDEIEREHSIMQSERDMNELLDNYCEGYGSCRDLTCYAASFGTTAAVLGVIAYFLIDGSDAHGHGHGHSHT